MQFVLTRPVRLAADELDPCGRVLPLPLLYHFQEAAGIHAAALGAGVTADLRPRNLTWVLSRYHLRFSPIAPAAGAGLLKTWPSSRHGLAALREFEIHDSRGQLLVAATSSWLLLSLESRRPVRLETYLPDLPALERRAVPGDFPSLPLPQQVDFRGAFRVERQDLDVNGHANHISYMRWALESLPAAGLAGRRLAELEVAFRGEAFLGDAGDCTTQLTDAGAERIFLQLLRKEEGGGELTRLRSRWSSGEAALSHQ